MEWILVCSSLSFDWSLRLGQIQREGTSTYYSMGDVLGMFSKGHTAFEEIRRGERTREAPRETWVAGKQNLKGWGAPCPRNHGDTSKEGLLSAAKCSRATEQNNRTWLWQQGQWGSDRSGCEGRKPDCSGLGGEGDREVKSWELFCGVVGRKCMERI